MKESAMQAGNRLEKGFTHQRNYLSVQDPLQTQYKRNKQKHSTNIL